MWDCFFLLILCDQEAPQTQKYGNLTSGFGSYTGDGEGSEVKYNHFTYAHFCFPHGMNLSRICIPLACKINKHQQLLNERGHELEGNIRDSYRFVVLNQLRSSKESHSLAYDGPALLQKHSHYVTTDNFRSCFSPAESEETQHAVVSLDSAKEDPHCHRKTYRFSAVAIKSRLFKYRFSYFSTIRSNFHQHHGPFTQTSSSED